MTGRPNVLLVVMDTTRALDTAPAAPSVTPVLAELGEQGTTYTRAFSSAPWTLPAHASLFTGTYTSRHAAHGDDPAARRQFEGRSFHPSAGADPRSRVFAEYIAPQPSVATLREHFEDLPEAVSDFDRTLRTVRTDEWKLVRAAGDDCALYDVSGAFDETDDQAGAAPETAAALAAELDRWLGSFDRLPTAGEVAMTEATERRLTELGYLQ